MDQVCLFVWLFGVNKAIAAWFARIVLLSVLAIGRWCIGSHQRFCSFCLLVCYETPIAKDQRCIRQAKTSRAVLLKS
jgi:hypothetical protein